MNKFQFLIEDLTKHIGFNLEIDEKNSVYLEYEGLFIIIHYQNEKNSILLSSEVAIVEDGNENSENVYRKALELSFSGIETDNCFLGLENDKLILSKNVDITDELDTEMFAQYLKSFADAAVHVRNNIFIAENKKPSDSNISENSTNLDNIANLV